MNIRRSHLQISRGSNEIYQAPLSCNTQLRRTRRDLIACDIIALHPVRRRRSAAKRLIVSCCSVITDSTASLLCLFYEHLGTDRQSIIIALRRCSRVSSLCRQTVVTILVQIRDTDKQWCQKLCPRTDIQFYATCISYYVNVLVIIIIT